MPEFLLPDLGEGLTEAEIIRWLVDVGDTINVDQLVVEVETAKAAVEVPAPFAGVVTRLHGDIGSTLSVGSPLITVGGPEADSQKAGFVEPGVVVAAGLIAEGSGNVLIGYGTSTATPRKRRQRRGSGGAASAVIPSAASATEPTRAAGVISPLVRKIARDNGLDLTEIIGSGPEGIIRRTDVEAAIIDRAAPVAQPREPDRDRRIPLRGLRRAIAEKLAASRREIPEATVWVDVDATELLVTRSILNGQNKDRPVSLLSLFARLTVAGLRRYPELNSRIDGEDILVLGAIHLGFAAQTDRGLVVPVVRDADQLTTRELSGAIGARTTAAREGSLAPADLTGGTFTVNNYGVFGVDGSAAIINPPEAAILGIGRIIERPWVVGGELVIRKLCQLTLAFDHRVCDGGTAGGFLRFLADCIESPVGALGDL
jgi:2-oxoisovalerate dehydrogenase E2 component (dihydrolipoyl transacylase)